ncbi:MAG: hypothetical protein OXH65_05755 [Paracoccaceae bacterium]|nr:hypothetical protein [Paracoccaceae bacterium]MDE2674597.1 hypothetical protein [Paracoccaceae bacterium]
MAENNQNNLDVELEKRRSKVRVLVTYAAAVFIFLGGPLLLILPVIASMYNPERDFTAIIAACKDVFVIILPIATGIVTHWFVSRKPKVDQTDEEKLDPLTKDE